MEWPTKQVGTSRLAIEQIRGIHNTKCVQIGQYSYQGLGKPSLVRVCVQMEESNLNQSLPFSQIGRQSKIKWSCRIDRVIIDIRFCGRLLVGLNKVVMML